MAGELRTRNAAFLVKIEATEGVDALPVAADAILVESVQSGVGLSTLDSTEITGAIDAGAPAVLGAPTTWTVTCRLRGPVGVPTSGNRPPADPLLQAAGFEAVFTAAIAAASLTSGTTQAATLAVSFPGTANALRGMPLLFGNAPHAGKIGSVTDYNPSRLAVMGETYTPALGAGNTAALIANALYRPLSTAIPSITCYHYVDGLLRKLVGARATMTLSMDAAGIPIATFTITGSWAGETDAAIPAGISPVSTAAPLFIQGALLNPAFAMQWGTVGVANFSLDLGNSLTSPADPNTANGFAGGLLVARDTRLSVSLQAQLVATRDVLGQILAGQQIQFVARAGSVVGNRLLVTVPTAQLLAAPDADDGGILRRAVEAKANGPNAGAFLCFY